MSKRLMVVALVLVLGGVIIAVSAFAQAKKEPPKEPSPDAAVDEEAKSYMAVGPGEVEKYPDKFEGKYVQLADFFGKRLSKKQRNRAFRELRRLRITGNDYVLFATHKASGSNMLCILSREDKEGMEILSTLGDETKILLQGRIGREVTTARGKMPIFMIDRMVRGHRPPPPKKLDKKKPVVIIVHYDAKTPSDRTVRRLYRRYKIPQPGRYWILDPYDQTKKIYLTVQF